MYINRKITQKSNFILNNVSDQSQFTKKKTQYQVHFKFRSISEKYTRKFYTKKMGQNEFKDTLILRF